MEVKLDFYTPLWVASKAIRTCWDSHDKSDTCGHDDIDFFRDGSAKCTVCGEEHKNGFMEPFSEAGEADKELIDRIGNKMKHTSVKNHINYTFIINGITTKTLLALTRHDVGTEFSVQSTRYTTKKSVKAGKAGYTYSKSDRVNKYLDQINEMIKDCVNNNEANDEISLLLPQAWQYNLVATFSLGALQHFLALRLKPDAHWDIRHLANLLLDAVPNEHKYLFEGVHKGND